MFNWVNFVAVLLPTPAVWLVSISVKPMVLPWPVVTVYCLVSISVEPAVNFFARSVNEGSANAIRWHADTHNHQEDVKYNKTNTKTQIQKHKYNTSARDGMQTHVATKRMWNNSKR